MKVSYRWLQEHFEKELPPPEKVAELLTMHTLEVEGVEPVGDDAIIELKVLPHRAHDCLGHRGVARELAVLIGLPLKEKSAREIPAEKTKHALSIAVEDPALCRRYVGRIVEDVAAGESPAWLKTYLEAVGQRSINNIVDITNYVMLETGQPMHAFDVDRLAKKNATVAIGVRTGRAAEKLTTLDDADVDVDEDTLVIADAEKPVALAGIKGGKKAEVTERTKHIMLEAANFEPANVRKTAQRLGIRTDSSKRFENEITPEFALPAMNLAVSLIKEISKDAKAGETVDFYPRKRRPYKIGVSEKEINELLGTKLAEKDITSILDRFGFAHEIVDNPVSRVLERVPELEGAPYVPVGTVLYDAPERFSCSSFINYLFVEAGVALPSLSVDQYVFGAPVDEAEARPGDAVFSNTNNGKIRYESVDFLPGTKVPEGVDHCGLYLGDGKVVHATRAAGKVVIERLAESAQFQNIVGYRRMAQNSEKRFVVTIPPERLDLRIREDMAEEIGRVYGYENIEANAVGNDSTAPEIDKTLHYGNIVRDALTGLGFSEIYTYALGEHGEVELENPMAEDKRFLRANLGNGIKKSMPGNVYNAPLFGLSDVKVFEIGKVFTGKGEHTACAFTASSGGPMLESAREKLESALGVSIRAKIEGGVIEFNLDELIADLPDPKAYVFPEKIPTVAYKSISPYPFVLRDIAAWTPEKTTENDVSEIIVDKGGKLLARPPKLFDRFEKDGRISYAFNLVFQSDEKTLTDDEVNNRMADIADAFSERGWNIR